MQHNRPGTGKSPGTCMACPGDWPWLAPSEETSQKHYLEHMWLLRSNQGKWAISGEWGNIYYFRCRFVNVMFWFEGNWEMQEKQSTEGHGFTILRTALGNRKIFSSGTWIFDKRLKYIILGNSSFIVSFFSEIGRHLLNLSFRNCGLCFCFCYLKTCFTQ